MLQSTFPECFQKPAAKPVARTSAFANTPAGSLQAIFCRSPVALRNISFASKSYHPMLCRLASLLHRCPRCFARLYSEIDIKREHKTEQLFIPEWCLGSWFTASPCPPSHRGSCAAQMLNADARLLSEVPRRSSWSPEPGCPPPALPSVTGRRMPSCSPASSRGNAEALHLSR